MAKLIVYNDGKALIPSYNSDKETFSKLKKGQYQIKIWKPRNLLHHRKLFAKFQMAIDNGIFEKINSKQFPSVENLLVIMKWLHLQHEKLYINPKQVIEIPSSIAFENMDEIEFTEFEKKCDETISELLGISVFDLNSNYGEYL